MDGDGYHPPTQLLGSECVDDGLNRSVNGCTIPV